MTDGSGKSHNPFSKIAGELRQKKEKLIKDNQREYQDRLEQAEEILVGDCFEAIGGITPQAYIKSGQVSFESEAFLWFSDGKKKLKGKVKRNSVEVAKKKGLQPNRRKIIIPPAVNLDMDAPDWVNLDLDEIFQRVRNHLSQEEFMLETNDGIEFTLLWSTG